MMVLYSGTTDPYSHRCRFVLFEKGMDFEIRDVDVFGLGEDVHVADFEVHALLEQHEAAAVRIGAGRSGVQHHHGVGPVINTSKDKTQCRLSTG